MAELKPRVAPVAWWTLCVLSLVYAVAFIDRAAMGLVAEPLRRDLGLTDTQIGLLTGFAFVLLYSIAGLPLGRLVDRTKRVPILAVGTLVWGTATAACGLATNFAALFTARMAVGLGEASVNPGAASLIADRFPKARLGGAMAIYTLGGFVLGGLAIAGGGALLAFFAARPLSIPIVGEVAEWQALFLVLGLISVALVPLLLTVREPARQGTSSDTVPAVRKVIGFLRTHGRATTALFIGIGCLAGIFAAIQAWVPALLSRRFGMAPSDAAIWFGLSFATAGAVGNIAGGLLVDAFRRRGYADAGARAGLVAVALLPPLAIAFAQASERSLALGLLIPLCFAAGLPFSIAPPSLQALSPNRMRGQVFAAYLLTASMLGFGGGPVLSAVLGEALFDGPLALANGFSMAALVAGLLALAFLARGLGRFPPV